MPHTPPGAAVAAQKTSGPTHPQAAMQQHERERGKADKREAALSAQLEEAAGLGAKAAADADAHRCGEGSPKGLAKRTHRVGCGPCPHRQPWRPRWRG